MRNMEHINPDTGKDTTGTTGPLKYYVPNWLKNEVRPRIAATLREIQAKAPNAQIVLMGYPQLITIPGDGVSCVVGVDAREIDWLNSVADVLATEMQGAAADAGTYAHSSNPGQDFVGKSVRSDPESTTTS